MMSYLRLAVMDETVAPTPMRTVVWEKTETLQMSDNRNNHFFIVFVFYV